MKVFAAILALTTAVMAAPTEVVARQNPPFFVQDSQACACTNAQGQAVPAGVVNYATCPYGNKLPNIGELSNFCFNTSPFARPLEQTFNSQWCANFPGYPTVTCKPVKLCQAYPQCKNLRDTYSLCGHPQEINPVYCDEV